MSANQEGPPREPGTLYHADSAPGADTYTEERVYFIKYMKGGSSWNHPAETMRPPHPMGRRDPCSGPLCPPLKLFKVEGGGGRGYGGHSME